MTLCCLHAITNFPRSCAYLQRSMGKYSSDSDSTDSGRGRRSKYSSRTKGRSQSPSSDSLYRRHKKRCKGRRSRSKERYSRSRRHGNKSSRRTSSSDSSTDDSRRTSNASKTRRSPVSSSSATNSSSALPQALVDNTPSSAEQLRAKVQRAIQAARSADNLLRQRRGEAADSNVPVPIPQAGLLEEINSDKFVQRSYTSSATAPRASLPDIPLPVVVDLTEEPKQDGGDLGVMSPALLEDQDGKQQRWVKKLFAIRQRALLGPIKPWMIHEV